MARVRSGRMRRAIGWGGNLPPALKTAILFAVLAVIAVAAALYDRNPDFSYVKITFLSGTESGNYYAVIARLADVVQAKRGHVTNIATAGSVDNINRLAAAKASCSAQFALAQDGLDWPTTPRLQLIGRLGAPESLLIFGRDADRVRSLADLRGKRLGIGPAGSGTERVVRQLLARVKGLDVNASLHTFDEELAMVQSGSLDFAAMVINKDAQLVVGAVRDRKLQIVDMAGIESLAHHLEYARVGTIHSGYYDPLLDLPPADKRVIEVDTLVIGNGCARDSVIQGLITGFREVFPDFLRVNHEQASVNGLPIAPAAQSYYDSGGPDVVGAHVPWFIDIMPTARWLQLIFGFSLLFNAMAVWHRFRLWRIDANRVRIEKEIPRLFEPGITVEEIATAAPEARHCDPEARERLDSVIDQFSELADRCRRQSLSILVPMGQEMSYRYQESLIAERLHALRAFCARVDRDPRSGPDSSREADA